MQPITTSLDKEIYELNLFETILIDNNSSIRRVPWGWVYWFRDTLVFIPFHNEFMPR